MVSDRYRKYGKPKPKTYNYQIELVSYELKINDIGERIKEPSYHKRLCDIKSVSRNEYYQAKKVGLNPTLLITMKGFEYSGEDEIKYNNQHYKITKTYELDEDIELTCELMTHDKN